MIKTENSQNFYYIKQLFCFLEVCQLKQVIEIDGVALDTDELLKEIASELSDLKYNFVTPTLTLKSNQSVVDFTMAYQSLLEAKSFLNHINPSLVNAVKHAPDLRSLTKMCYNHYVDNADSFTDVRLELINVINLADKLFESIETALNEKHIPTMQLISYINLLASIEFFFSLSEIGKVGFLDEIESTKDNPWTN